jgi:hypothetical protein
MLRVRDFNYSTVHRDAKRSPGDAAACAKTK